MIRPTKNICVFQVSRPYLSFCPDTKHFIVKHEQNIVKYMYGEKCGKKWLKTLYTSKILE